MNQPAFFNTQFWRTVGGVQVPAASCQLETRPAGTPAGTQATYTDQAGGTPNANPIILDADGRCDLWLDPALEYLLQLLAPVAEGGATLAEWDDVVGAAVTTGTVTSVNGETGAVVLDAADIGYATSATADWFTGTELEGSLDQIITRLNAPPADSITVEDAGGLFTATNVEDALAEIVNTPSRTGNDGKVLQLVSGALAWMPKITGTLGAGAEFSIGTLVVKWGVSASVPTDTSATVTFTTPFPSACRGVLLNPTVDSGVGGGTQYAYNACVITAANFKINNDATTSTFFWLAVGE